MHKNVSNYMCKKLCGSAGSARTKPAWIMSYVDGLKMWVRPALFTLGRLKLSSLSNFYISHLQIKVEDDKNIYVRKHMDIKSYT